MDAAMKLRMRIGEHEFEAEGPVSEVKAQVLVFARLIGQATVLEPRQAPPSPQLANRAVIEKLLNAPNGNVLSLKVPARTPEQSILLLLLGQHLVRGNPQVAGSLIMEGLRATGQAISRADYALKRHGTSGYVISLGAYRRRRYKLTTDGTLKALEIARSLAPATPAPPAATPAP